jgi:lysozyme
MPRAAQLFRQDVIPLEITVNFSVVVFITQHQFDALVSFTYNVGPTRFRGSTLLRKLNNSQYDSVPTEMSRWIYSGGRMLPGLVDRRADEGRLFRYGDYGN